MKNLIQNGNQCELSMIFWKLITDIKQFGYIKVIVVVVISKFVIIRSAWGAQEELYNGHRTGIIELLSIYSNYVPNQIKL